VAKSRGKDSKGDAPHDGGGRTSDALQRAFADVKPLDSKTRKRVMPPPEGPTARAPARTDATGKPTEPLRVERESNGIVSGRREATHASILDALEDPRLEVDAECDLHGHTVREAEREMHRFVRDCQQDGKRWVLIIVGKGLHSPGGKGTLKSKMVEALSKRAPSRFVLAFRTAPRHLGGTGALVARLVDRL
jgi:DNA-nicking Smr family endonuclease